MRTVTATEASRPFAALLDEVEWGQTVIVTAAGEGSRRSDQRPMGTAPRCWAYYSHRIWTKDSIAPANQMVAGKAPNGSVLWLFTTNLSLAARGPTASVLGVHVEPAA